MPQQHIHPTPTMPNQPPTHYQILAISPTTLTSQHTPQDASALVKRAYRRALLNHHPDKKTPQTKTKTTTTTTTSTNAIYSIDQISTAFAVLSNPAQRADYDRALRLQAAQSSAGAGGVGDGETAQSRFQTGIENVDLDDLDYDDASDEWYRSCRCGNLRSYRFGEDDLEEAADLGELMVGCADCSLWLRVHFAVVADDEEEDAVVDGVGKGMM
ncbi:hypothetical protein B0T17DRAFT_537273 [Bombardia bombarda]|uniref:Diphthamide biosynthesis protein 4 n=1 Tax=Bombardia bombarda TaxID=252184 RepID=A0AA39WMM9_9PEZI|nr:hypothetical protein B0T17DRAFT_537273 [Bombardia bombarda]